MFIKRRATNIEQFL